MVYCGMSHSDSDSDSGPSEGKKEYIFTNKKDAVEAFKNLLRDKVSVMSLYDSNIHLHCHTVGIPHEPRDEIIISVLYLLAVVVLLLLLLCNISINQFVL